MSLEKVELPKSVVKIEDRVFYDCKNLASVKLSSHTNSIGVQAFSGCEKLKKIDLPATLNYIGVEAFRNCSSLEEIICRASTPPQVNLSLGYKGVVIVPKKSQEAYLQDDIWKQMIIK